MYFTIKSNHGSLETGRDFPEEMTKNQALLFSIEKWKALAHFVEDGAYPRDGGLTTCALCVKFHSGEIKPTPCSDCPIMQATGQGACAGTPYDDYCHAREDRDRTGMLEAAYAEIEFLEELLGHGEYIVRLGHGPLKGTIHVRKAYSKEDALEQVQKAFGLFNIDRTYYLGKDKIIITFDHTQIYLVDIEEV